MKGNTMIRLIALMILVPAALAHYTGQIDLSQPTWLWLTLFAGLNALQSTFTGWCPASTFFGKDKNTGQCCATDTTGSCCDSTPKNPETKSSAGCCSSSAENTAPSTSSIPVSEGASSCYENDDNCLDIKVLGTGCQNCTTTLKLIEMTAAELKVECCLTKVEDIAEIAGFGVMATPGVVINGKVVHSGSIPTKTQVTEWLTASSTTTPSKTSQGCCS